MKYDFRKYSFWKAWEIETPGFRDSQYIGMRGLRVLISAKAAVQKRC